MDRFAHRRNPQDMFHSGYVSDAAKMDMMQRQMNEYDALIQDIRMVNLKAAENMERMQGILQESLEKIEELQKDKDDMQANTEELVSDLKRQIEELLQEGNEAQAEKEAVLSEMKTQMDELLPQMKTQIDKLLPQMKTQTDEILPLMKTQADELLSQMKAQINELVPQMKTQTDELLPQMKAQINEILPQMKTQTDEILPQMQTKLEEAFKKSDDFLHMENVKVYRNVQASMIEELDKRFSPITQKQDEGIKSQKPFLPISIAAIVLIVIDIIINLFNIAIKF